VLISRRPHDWLVRGGSSDESENWGVSRRGSRTRKDKGMAKEVLLKKLKTNDMKETLELCEGNERQMKRKENWTSYPDPNFSTRTT